MSIVIAVALWNINFLIKLDQVNTPLKIISINFYAQQINLIKNMISRVVHEKMCTDILTGERIIFNKEKKNRKYPI